MRVKSYDIILRHVDGYGWLPIIERDGKELFRGSFFEGAEEALHRAEFEYEVNENAKSY